jgi:hypothetical protein
MFFVSARDLRLNIALAARPFFRAHVIFLN